MTEDDAKTKWCPWARAPLHGGVGHIAINRPERCDSRCIASGCMAWRWTGQSHGYCGNAGATNGHGP